MLRLAKHILVLSLRVLWVIIQHVVYWPEYVTWCILIRPILWIKPELYWFLESRIYSWFITLFGLLTWYNGHRVIEYGTDIKPYNRDRCIIMPNHQSLGDVPILFGILHRYDVYRDLMWIMDRILKYTHFGFCAFQHGDCFIQQKTGSGREREMQMLSDHVRDVYYPLDRRWVLIFPEGGFLYKRRAKSQAYAKKNDLPVLQHVSLPRVGGIQVLFDAMSETKNGAGNGVKYVIDLTIGHPNNETMSLQSFMLGTQGAKDLHVYFRLFPVADIPKENEDLTKWLYQVYAEKERLLAYFYEHGEFPQENGCFKKGPRCPIENPLHNFVKLSAFYMFFGLLLYYVAYQTWAILIS